MSNESPLEYRQRVEKELRDITTVLVVAVGLAFVLAFSAGIVASLMTAYAVHMLKLLLIMAGVLLYALWAVQWPKTSISWVADVDLLFDISTGEFLWAPHATYHPQSLAHQAFEVLDKAGNTEIRVRLKEPLRFELFQKTVFADFMEYATLKWLFENAFFIEAYVHGLKYKSIDLPDMPEQLNTNYFVASLAKAQPKGIYSGLIQYRFDIPEDFSIKYSAPNPNRFEITLQGKYCKATVGCYLTAVHQVASMTSGPAPMIAGFPIDSVSQEYFLKRQGNIYGAGLLMVFNSSFNGWRVFFRRAIAGSYLHYIALLAQSFLDYFSASENRKKAVKSKEAEIYDTVKTIEMSVQDMSTRFRRIEEKLKLEN